MDGGYRTLEPGQLICSARKIAEHIGVSRDRIRRILNDMIEDEMLHRERYNRKTVYTVLNWANYQHGYVTDEAGNEGTRTAMNDATNKKKEDRRKNKDDKGDEDEGKEFDLNKPNEKSLQIMEKYGSDEEYSVNFLLSEDS